MVPEPYTRSSEIFFLGFRPYSLCAAAALIFESRAAIRSRSVVNAAHLQSAHASHLSRSRGAARQLSLATSGGVLGCCAQSAASLLASSRSPQQGRLHQGRLDQWTREHAAVRDFPQIEHLGYVHTRRLPGFLRTRRCTQDAGYF